MIDVLTHKTKPNLGFTGAKPLEWTYWVLNALGYCKGDVVDDLFSGSGLVAEAIKCYE